MAFIKNDMEDMKYILPYIPHKVNVMYTGMPCEVEGVDLYNKNTLILERIDVPLSEVKLILRPLSSLTKETKFRVAHSGYTNLDDLIHDILYKKVSVMIWEKLIENHYDVYGLIENGKAIDINSLK